MKQADDVTLFRWQLIQQQMQSLLLFRFDQFVNRIFRGLIGGSFEQARSRLSRVPLRAVEQNPRVALRVAITAT